MTSRDPPLARTPTRRGKVEFVCWGAAAPRQRGAPVRAGAAPDRPRPLYHDGKEPCCVVFVVPGPRRLETLRRAYREFEQQWRERQSRAYAPHPDGRWPLIASTAVELCAQGPLAAVWERLDQQPARRLALTDLPVRSDMNSANLSSVLGRRWRKDQPDFWTRLSPLGTTPAAETKASPVDRDADAFAERLRRLRETQLEQALQDAADIKVGDRAAAPKADLRSSGINGSMDDPEDDVEEERWR